MALAEASGTYKTSEPMDIKSLHNNQFYTVYWNIKLNKHSLYYLTITAKDTYENIKSVLTLISKI